MSEQAARATKKQQLMLEFIGSFIAEHDYGPSYREIMRALDYKSVSTVAVHVDGLIAKGFLVRADNSPRSLQVVGRIQNSEVKQAKSIKNELVNKAEELLTDSDDTDKKAQTATLIEALSILGYSEESASLRQKMDSL